MLSITGRYLDVAISQECQVIKLEFLTSKYENILQELKHFLQTYPIFQFPLYKLLLQ